MGQSPDPHRTTRAQAPEADIEATFIRKPAPATRPPVRRPIALIALLGMGGAAMAGLVAWLLLARPGTPPLVPASPSSTAADIATPPAAIPITAATEAEIAVHDSDRLRVFRYADNPLILILDYPTLRQQGLALNRVAAFIEKASLPKDRVLDDETLAAEIARSGETVDSYYYGHDYAAADLARFFATADRDGVRLNPEEAFLRALVRQEGLTDPGNRGAIITVARIGPDSVDAFTRRIILRHELSHGEFFTNPAYAAFVRQAWDDILSAEERAAFRRFLLDQQYDPGNTDLLANEMQAFLMFTPDERYISAERLGISSAMLDALRARFLAAMPEGWLRHLAVAPLP